MAILTLEDKTGVTKGLLFPDAYKQFKDVIDTLNVFKIDGKIKMEQGEEPVIFISDVEKLKQSVQQRIIFHCKHPTEIQDVFSHIERFKGAGANYTPVYVECGNIRCLLKSAYWVDMTVFERYSHTGFDIEIAEW